MIGLETCTLPLSMAGVPVAQGDITHSRWELTTEKRALEQGGGVTGHTSKGFFLGKEVFPLLSLLCSDASWQPQGFSCRLLAWSPCRQMLGLLNLQPVLPQPS